MRISTQRERKYFLSDLNQLFYRMCNGVTSFFDRACQASPGLIILGYKNGFNNLMQVLPFHIQFKKRRIANCQFL